MKLRVFDFVSVAAFGVAGAATALFYDQLPERVATHFGLDGKPNGWMPRPYATWGVLALLFVVWLMVRWLPAALPKSEKNRLKEAPVALVGMLTAVFMAFVHLIVLRAALQPGAAVNQPVIFAISVLTIGLGLVMPRIRRNGFIGVRTPWTLASDENWARTHRVAGYTMAVAGVVALAGSFVEGLPGIAVSIGAILVGTLAPAIYSLVLARRLDQG